MGTGWSSSTRPARQSEAPWTRPPIIQLPVFLSCQTVGSIPHSGWISYLENGRLDSKASHGTLQASVSSSGTCPQAVLRELPVQVVLGTTRCREVLSSRDNSTAASRLTVEGIMRFLFSPALSPSPIPFR